MDVREALLNSMPFAISPSQVEVIGIERDIDLDEGFYPETKDSVGYQLAKADMIRIFVMTPNVSEGGVSISITDRQRLIGIANAIYGKYEPESIILEEHPKVIPVID